MIYIIYFLIYFLKGDVSVFLEKLSDEEFQKLYTQPATCLAIFRYIFFVID